MAENIAKEFLDRIFGANTAKDIYAIRIEIIQARERGEISDDVARELLAAADRKLAEIERKTKSRPLPVGVRKRR